MPSAPTFIVRAQSRLSRTAFMLRERWLARLAGGPALRILFSRQASWEPMIRSGFARGRHEVEFGDLAGRDWSRYDLVVPLTVADTLLLGAQRDALAHNLLPIPAPHCVHLCNDKVLLNRELAGRGFAEYIPAMLDKPAPPFVLKARVAENSEHCYLIQGAADRAAHEALIGHDGYFCQQLVPGASEFAAHMLVAGGRVVAEATVEYIADRDVFIKNGAAFIGRKLGRCAFTPLFERMLASIGFEGLCCLNYKVIDGRPMLLEINPRFGGSLSPLFFAFIRHLPLAHRLASARGTHSA